MNEAKRSLSTTWATPKGETPTQDVVGSSVVINGGGVTAVNLKTN